MTPLGIPGVENGYNVDGVVWRSAQPKDAAWPLIARAGCRAILDLNSSGDAASQQLDLVHAAGMQYHSLDWSGVLPPCPAEVDVALAFLHELPSPILVHCEHGSDRTGTLCAIWRMDHDGWTLEQALDEAFTSLGLQGMHEFWMSAAAARYAHDHGHL